MGHAFKPQGKIKGALTTVFCAISLPSMGTCQCKEFKIDRLSAWKAFSGPNFEMVDVDGQHYTMLSDEHVVSFASHMHHTGKNEPYLSHINLNINLNKN
jgi:hypothetical protein